MYFKKTAVLAICSFALLGCGPKTKIESGTTISATVWNIMDSVFAKDLVLSGDEQVQVELRKMNCQIAIAPVTGASSNLRVVTTATLACDNQKQVDFSAEVLSSDGQPGLNEVEVKKPITVKLLEPVSI